MGNDLRKASIHGLVRVPTTHAQRQLIEPIVTDRPEHGVAEAVIIDAYFLCTERDGHDPHRRQLSSNVVADRWLEGIEIARPTDPDATGALMLTPEPRCETANAALHGRDPILGRDGDWQPIRDDDQPSADSVRWRYRCGRVA